MKWIFKKNEFSNAYCIIQIWNRMLPAEIKCFKTFSSFPFHLITHTLWWSCKNQSVERWPIIQWIKSSPEDLVFFHLNVFILSDLFPVFIIYIFSRCIKMYITFTYIYFLNIYIHTYIYIYIYIYILFITHIHTTRVIYTLFEAIYI